MSDESDPATPPRTQREKPSIPQAKRRFKHAAAEEDAPADRRARRDDTISEPEAGFSEEEALDEEIEALNDRLRTLSARKGKPVASAEAEGRGAKFHRLGRNKTPPSAARDANSPDAASSPKPGGPVVLPTLRPPVFLRPGYELNWHPAWLWASAGALALTLLAFGLGRFSVAPATSGRDPAASTAAPAWSQPEIAQLDKILAADASGNVAAAYDMAKNLSVQAGGNRADLGRYLTLLQARRGSINDAEADLLRQTNTNPPPQVVAALQERFGFISARRRDFKVASECFANAAAADPFNGEIFYRWGESLRRVGKLPEAVSRFQETLLRLPDSEPEYESLRQCAAFRQRLTMIEFGNDAEVKTGLDAQLRLPAPNAYWLLTAVAYDLQHNDLPGASAVMQRAKVLAPAEQIAALFNDYYLRQLALRSREIAADVPELTAERRHQLETTTAYFIDP